MKLKLIFLFVIVLLGLNYSFSSGSPLARDDYVSSEDSDPRSPIFRSFTALSAGQKEEAPVKKKAGSKKSRTRKGIPRADSPSSTESEEDEGPSITGRRRGAEWNITPLAEEEEQKSASAPKKGWVGTDSALDSSDGGTPPSTRRSNPKLSLVGLTDEARQAFWKLMNRVEKEGGSAEKQLDRLRQEIASATNV
jgi:hypothetical protein